MNKIYYQDSEHVLFISADTFDWRKMRKRDCNFNMIELLVVITIIAILASLLLPVFRKVKEKSKLTLCTANLKHIGIGMTLYANDDVGSHFPQNPAFGHDGSHGRSLELMLMNYVVKNTVYGNSNLTPRSGIFMCPASPFSRGGNGEFYLEPGVLINGKTGSAGAAEANGYAIPIRSKNMALDAMATEGRRDPRAVNASMSHRLKFPTKPYAFPIQFCCRLRAAGTAKGINDDGVESVVEQWNCGVASSWHGKQDGERPTFFADGHVAVLLDPKYTIHGASYIEYGEDFGSYGYAKKPYDFEINIKHQDIALEEY